ncbi:hypothetical protein KM043_005406 [Ampulex compressa]|nr:hypothetical protein KM043_005406 [Ampulex compressa]
MKGPSACGGCERREEERPRARTQRLRKHSSNRDPEESPRQSKQLEAGAVNGREGVERRYPASIGAPPFFFPSLPRVPTRRGQVGRLSSSCQELFHQRHIIRPAANRRGTLFRTAEILSRELRN